MQALRSFSFRYIIIIQIGFFIELRVEEFRLTEKYEHLQDIYSSGMSQSGISGTNTVFGLKPLKCLIK